MVSQSDEDSGKRETLCIPAPLLPELRALLNEIPDSEISNLAADVHGKGGFRAGTKPAILRAGLANALAPGRELSLSLRRAFRRHCRLAAFAQLLTASTLKSNFADIAALFGVERALAALWLDDRDDVRQAAIGAIGKYLSESPEPLPSAEEAKVRIAELIDPILSKIGAAGGADDATVERLKAEIAELKRMNRAFKDIGDRYERATERERKLADENREQRKAIEARDRELLSAKAKIGELEAGLSRLRSDNEQRVAAEVEHRTADAFLGLLRRNGDMAREIEKVASEDDLLARAEAALANQAQADAVSGTFGAFRARLAEIDSARERVRAALADAVSPLPQLRAIAEELDGEHVRLREMLGDADVSDVSGHCEGALFRAVGAADAGSFATLRQLVDTLDSLGALEKATKIRLDYLLRMKQDFMHATTAPVPREGAVLKDSPGDPMWILQGALRAETTAILLVDAHNMLFALQSRYLHEVDGRLKPDAAARGRLVDDFKRLAAGHPTLRVWIVFDGEVASETSASDNVRVSYSGGVGEHRADGVLVDLAKFFRQSNQENVLVVTNDGGLSGDAIRQSARPLSPGAILSLL